MLLKQTILYLPAQVLGPLFQFVAIIAWTHWLAPEGMGIFALVMATQELGYLVSLFWFSLYTVRYANEVSQPEMRERYLGTELWLMLAASLFVAVVSGLLLMTVGSEWPSWGLLVATIAYSVSRSIVMHLSDRARANTQILAYTLLQSIGPVLGLVLGLVGVTWFAATPGVVIGCYAAATIASLLIVIPMIGVAVRLTPLDRDILRKALTYGLAIVACGPLSWFAMNGIRYVVEYLEGSEAVGLITVGWGIGQRLSFFAAMLVAAAAFPLAVRKAHEEGMERGMEQLVSNGRLLFVLLAPAFTGLWALNEPIVKLIVAEPYWSMTISILPLAMLAGTMRAVRIHYTNQTFMLREEPANAMRVDIVDALATLIGCIVGYRLGGLIGAVVGATIAAGIGLVASILFSRYRYGVRLPWADFLRIAIASAVMGALVNQLPVGAGLVPVILAIGIGVAAYGCLLCLLFPSEARKFWEKLTRFIVNIRAPVAGE